MVEKLQELQELWIMFVIHYQGLYFAQKLGFIILCIYTLVAIRIMIALYYAVYQYKRRRL